MDALRTLSLAFLSAVASTPAFAQTFNATSGSMVIGSGDFFGTPYTFAGTDFSASVMFETDPLENPLLLPFSPGPLDLQLFGDTATPSLTMSLTMHGVPWGLPMNTAFDGEAIAQFDINPRLMLTGPGTYSTTFAFTGSFLGAPQSVVSSNPALGCDVITCTLLSFNGGGTVKLNVDSDPNFPGSLDITQASFAFKPSSAPTPSSASLLLLGLVALGLRAWSKNAARTAR